MPNKTRTVGTADLCVGGDDTLPYGRVSVWWSVPTLRAEGKRIVGLIGVRGPLEGHRSSGTGDKMDDVARQLEQVRREIAGLLSAYPRTADEEKEALLERCERLGGEVQELVGLLKIRIRRIVAVAEADPDVHSDALRHVQHIARHGLRVAHCVGEEVSAAVRLIRRLRVGQPAGEP